MSRTKGGGPILSIITICYNCLPDLRRTRMAVEALLIDDAIEHIIIDGGSNDGTREYLSGLDCRSISQRDRGIYDAINKGIRCAVGEFVWIVNAGDLPDIEPVALRCYLDAMRSRRLLAGVFGSKLVFPGSEHMTSQQPSVRWLWLKMTIIHQSIIYRRDAHRAFGLYRLRYRLAADYDFVLRLTRDRRHCLGISHHPLSVFALGGSSDIRFVASRREAVQICARRFGGLALISAGYYSLVWARRLLRGGRLR